jgi:aryl carrier-like protein
LDAGPSVNHGEGSNPNHELTAMLKAIWSALLDKDNIDEHANFFELGGNSLLSIKLLAAIRSRVSLRGEVQLISLFEHPTIGEFAEYLRREGLWSAPAE